MALPVGTRNATHDYSSRMTGSALERLDVGHDDLLARRRPAEWAREAESLEAELPQYPEERVDILCEAGHAWSKAGDLDRAETCYRQVATEQVESGMPDPRVYYASFLLEERDTVRGYELLDEVRAGRSTEPFTYHFVAESLEVIDDREQALHWANSGLTRCYPPPFDPDVDQVVADQALALLLETRRRLRQALDQPLDALDELGEEARAATSSLLDPVAHGDPEADRPVMLYWSAEDFRHVLEHWPRTHPEAGKAQDPHTEHRRNVERRLRESAAGTTPLVVFGEVRAFEEFCAEDALDPSLASSQDEYAAEMVLFGTTQAWPPERNQPCWCGSDRKYKKCCGAPGFVGG